MALTTPLVIVHRVLRGHDGIRPSRVHDQLAAVLPERAEVSRRRAQKRDLIVDKRHVAIPIKSARIPVRVMEGKVSKEVDPNGFPGIHNVAAPSLFAPPRPPLKDLLTRSGVPCALVDLLD